MRRILIKLITISCFVMAMIINKQHNYITTKATLQQNQELFYNSDISVRLQFPTWNLWFNSVNEAGSDGIIF